MLFRHWPYRALHRHLLFGAVMVALVLSMAPWRWQTATPIPHNQYLGPAVTQLQLIKAPIPSREEAANLLLLLHSDSVYHSVGFFTLTALCHRTPETEILWTLEPSSREQTLPSGVRVLRTGRVPGDEVVTTEQFTIALERECDIGSFRPLETRSNFIYWYQPVHKAYDPTWSGEELRKAQIREIATYQLEAVVGK